MAVFYRTNAQSRPFEEVLMRVGIPYQIIGGIRFYERKEVKDLLAHLKLLVNPRDVISLRRVVECRPTGVGPKTLADLIAMANGRDEPVFTLLQRADFAQCHGGRVSAKLAAFAAWCRDLGRIPLAPVSECVRGILIHSGLLEHYRDRTGKDPLAEDRIENMKAFVVRAAEFEEARPDAALPELLQDIALVADVDNWDRGAETLSLMTLHSAKGLEFPYVFIVGVEQGLLPHQNSRKDEQIEEERRLFYVGITRTQAELCVLHAATRRNWSGEADCRQPSGFIAELPDETVETLDLCRAHSADPETDWVPHRRAPSRRYRDRPRS
jgi:DNA helicase-2/ATP-dependent DNA helicase PcrA